MKPSVFCLDSSSKWQADEQRLKKFLGEGARIFPMWCALGDIGAMYRIAGAWGWPRGELGAGPIVKEELCRLF